MKYKIILASNSPRRRELLAGLDVNFEVKVLRGIDESYPEDLDAYDVAEYIAQKKADAYRSFWMEMRLLKRFLKILLQKNLQANPPPMICSFLQRIP